MAEVTSLIVEIIITRVHRQVGTPRILYFCKGKIRNKNPFVLE